jgi:glycosyltransferase involved in cell wall biosynthesis
MIFRKLVIFDMHENYPQALKEFNKKGIINFLFKNPFLAEKLEDISIKKVDKIIVVVDENKKRLENMGVPSEKIYVVSNTVDLETFKLNVKSTVNFSSYENKFVILYSGTVSPERGLKTAVFAMKNLKRDFSNAILIILGDGKSVGELDKIRSENNLEDNVILQPWCGHEKLPDYIARANLCIIPQPNNDFINTTIPHKLFEYMAIGKPVLVSDAEPLQRIVEETNSGLVFKSNNYEDFADKVIMISSSSENFGLNGIKAVEEKYNWFSESKNLFLMYQNLTQTSDNRVEI